MIHSRLDVFPNHWIMAMTRCALWRMRNTQTVSIHDNDNREITCEECNIKHLKIIIALP